MTIQHTPHHSCRIALSGEAYVLIILIRVMAAASSVGKRDVSCVDLKKVSYMQPPKSFT